MNSTLVGKAGAALAFFGKAVAASEAEGRSPLFFLLHGPPGVGKTSAARALIEGLLQCSQFEVAKYSGTQVKIDTVEELARTAFHTSLFSKWRAIHIDEVDHMPRIAQVRFLTLLDDVEASARGVAVVCTCNSDLGQLEDRFQSRFTPIPITAPSAGEIQSHLMQSFSGMPADTAAMIAAGACGNVRTAMKDGKSWMLCQ